MTSALLAAVTASASKVCSRAASASALLGLGQFGSPFLIRHHRAALGESDLHPAAADGFESVHDVDIKFRLAGGITAKVHRLGDRPDDQNFFRFCPVQRQQPAFVFEQHNRPLRRAQGQRVMRRRINDFLPVGLPTAFRRAEFAFGNQPGPDVVLALVIADDFHRGIGVGGDGFGRFLRLTQPQQKNFRAQDALRRAIHGGLGYFALLHGPQNIRHVMMADQFHIHARIQAGDGRLVIVPDVTIPAITAARAEFGNVAHVRGDKAVEAPLLAQQRFEQPGVRVARHAVERVMRRHDRAGVRDFHRRLERLHVDFAQRALGGFKTLAIRARPRLAVGDEMFRRGDDLVPGEPRVVPCPARR